MIGNLFKVNPLNSQYETRIAIIMIQVFDPDNSGSVVPTELLVAFSMSMKGSVTDKLR